MLRKSRSRGISLVASALLLAGAVGAAQAANPNQAYDFRACWDDGVASGTAGLIGTQTWSALRVTAVSFGFEHAGFGEFYTIPGARSGSETSGWHAPQGDGAAFVGALLNGRRVVATATIPEPSDGWSTLPACPVH